MGIWPDKTIRLGVTGLSGSGKTVFLTSLIHQLLKDSETQKNAEALLSQTQLPFFQMASQNRLVEVSLSDRPHPTLPPFRYERFARSLLSDQPEWPESTSDISFFRLTLLFHSASKMKRLLGKRRIHLEVVDYPGEWLLDLPLMDQDFSQWSHQMLQLLEEPLRRYRAADFFNVLEKPDEKAGESLSRLFAETLKGLKYDGFQCIQPGRMILPGSLSPEDPRLQFAPLPHPSQSRLPEALYRRFEANYRRYVKELIRPFYRNYLKDLDAQIVLLDVLQALNGGHNAFTDMQEALKTILRHYRYGKGWWNLFSHRIEKVLFAATKADHVGPHQIPALKGLTEEILEDMRQGLFSAQTRFRVEAVSALISSRILCETHEGEKLELIAGQPKGENGYVAVYPGEVPFHLPTGKEWAFMEQNRQKGEGFSFPALKPPVLDSRLMPHYNMDRILNFLLEGDTA